MIKLPMLSVLSLRVLILSALSASLVSAVPANLLLARQSTCPTNAFRCENSSFCCSNGNTCISLAGNTTVLCCPKDSTCSRIQAITCNLDSLNAEDHPDAPVKTTVFDVALTKCGDMCCPFGYSCSGEGSECVKDQDQSQPPKGHSTTTSASTSTTTSTTRSTGVPTTQPSTTSSSTTSSSATSTQVPTASATSDEATGGKADNLGPDVKAIVGGVVGGGAAMILVAIIIFCCVRRRARGGSASSEKLRSDRSGFSTIISEPIVQPNSYRTEFILRPSTPPRTDQPSIPCISEDRITRRSIRNPFNSPNPSDAGTNSRIASFCEDSPPRQGQVGARLAPIRTMKASSQYLKPHRTSIHRQPSGECINVFADSNAVDDQFNRQTTFTELMDRADLKGVGRDKPYVPGATPRI